MKQALLSSTALALVLAGPSVAAAPPASSGGACPPGSWFCAGAPQEHPAAAGQPVQTLKPLPDPDADADGDGDTSPSAETPPEKTAPPPPVVVYRPPPPPPPAVLSGDEPLPYEYFRPRRHPPISPPQEWGINVHFEGALIGNGAQHNASMGGLGAGLRFKPARSFGLEADLDFASGDHDYLGDKRSETAFTLNGLFFLNPRSHAQLYLLAGFGWSGAHVTCDSCSTTIDNNYSYFGGQLGAGLELRLGRVLAFNADIRGFLRGRTDNLAKSQPEFDNPRGCSTTAGYGGPCTVTNTSGGGLLTGGMTLYF